MHKQAMTIAVTACFLFYTGCAPVVTQVQVENSEYDHIQKVEKISVTTKDGKQHEVIQFEFTETHLVGKELFPKARTEPIEISLSDIASIKIKGVRDANGKIITGEEIEKNITTNRRTGGAILGAIGFAVLGFIPSCALGAAVGNSGGSGDTNAGTVVFFGLEIGFIVLGGYLGYKGGKSADQRKAVKKIEQQREREGGDEKEGKELIPFN